MEEYYIVEKSELIGLLASYLKLLSLEQDGVDNWEWYGESFREVKQANVPEQLYEDVNVPDNYKEDFRNGEVSFRDVAAAMVDYEYDEAKYE